MTNYIRINSSIHKRQKDIINLLVENNYFESISEFIRQAIDRFIETNVKNLIIDEIIDRRFFIDRHGFNELLDTLVIDVVRKIENTFNKRAGT